MIKRATSIMMRLAQIQIELMELSQDYARDGSKHGSDACDTARLHVSEAQKTIHMNLKPPGFPKLSTLPSVSDPYRFHAPWHTGYFEGPDGDGGSKP